MKIKNIKESPDYRLQINNSIEEPEIIVYQLLNKETQVVELETRLLPQAYKYLEELQAALDAIRDEANSVTKAAPILVPKKDIILN